MALEKNSLSKQTEDQKSVSDNDKIIEKKLAVFTWIILTLIGAALVIFFLLPDEKSADQTNTSVAESTDINVDECNTKTVTPAEALVLNSGALTKSGQAYQSGVLVSNAASLILSDSTIKNTGTSSSLDKNSFEGLGSGVLAETGGKITLSCVDITTTGQDAHGMMASGGGNIIANDVIVSTRGANSAPITIGDGGAITVQGGTYTSSGADAPSIRSTGGNINLLGAKLTAKSGILLKAVAQQHDGSFYGGNVILTADKQTLIGDMIFDEVSGLVLTLKENSSLTGAINHAQTASGVDLTLDNSSSWTLTGDSYITTLSGAAVSGSLIANITGNGHNLYYESGKNGSLDGKTYSLVGGGQLIQLLPTH